MPEVPFPVVSIGGAAPTTPTRARRNTIELAAGATVVINLQFTDHSDDQYLDVLHCHHVIHEDDGMMPGLLVRSP